jgi:predicted  nucleic acid-binding Zn-ribbon protein
MFNKKLRKRLANESYSRAIKWDAMEQSHMRLRHEVDELRQKISITRLAQADAKAMDALTAMMSELARRVDLAGIADLPSTCVCESCGCKK